MTDRRRRGLMVAAAEAEAAGRVARPSPKKAVRRMRLDLLANIHPSCKACRLYWGILPRGVVVLGGEALCRELHERWLAGASLESLARWLASWVKERGLPRAAAISADSLRRHFNDHVDYELALARRTQEAWARRQPGEVAAESVANLPAAAHIAIQRVAEYAMADLEIGSVAEMVMAAKWAQDVLGRAYEGLRRGQADLSPIRILTELRAVIPQQHWTEFTRRLSAGKRGLPPAVIERVEEAPPGEPLGRPRPERPDPAIEAGRRLAAWERARNEARERGDPPPPLPNARPAP